MTRNSKPGNRGKFESIYDKPVRNASGTTIPPYAIMQVVGGATATTDEVYQVAQAASGGNRKYLINSPLPIDAGEPGHATDQYPAICAYEFGSGSPVPVPGELWGPFGGFRLSTDGSGFLIVGEAEDGLVRVAEAPPLATAGADFPLIIVRNVSGLSRGNRSIFGIGEPLNSPALTLPVQPTFLSVPPVAGQFWVVALSNVGNGNYVDAAPIGVLAVQIDYRGQEYINPALAHWFVDCAESNYANLVSAQDGPGRILWREKQGVSGGGTNGIQWAFIQLDHQGVIAAPRAVITEAVTPATGTLNGLLIPGKGKARLYNNAGGNAGAAWVPGSIVDVETWMRGTTAVGKPVLLRPSRRLPNGHTIYEIQSEGCAVIPPA